jgi:purine-cytosine permease-like protein
VVSAGVAVVLMLSNVNDHIGAILTFQGVSMFAWTASMIADLLIVKKLLKIGPSHIEYRRGELRDWNPVGPIALLIGSVVGAYFALFNPGTISAATSAFMAGGIAFVIHIILAITTQGKYYYVNQGKVLERESSTKI